jgi:dTDP-4-dehydrorhamnose reductase
MRLAIFGARGQLAAAVAHECTVAGHEVIAFDRTAVDVTEPAAVREAVARVRPDAIVNGAAYNAVDAAEDHPLEALEVNAFAVRTLAQAAGSCGAVLVHYSTDFVFDGASDRPYGENDRPNPRSVYGASKLLGEWFALDEAPRAYVLRVESLFGRVDGVAEKGSAAAIITALREGRAARVFTDRTVSPTYIWDAARATRLLLEESVSPGLYHCANSGHCSWLEFALEAARLLGIEPRVEKVCMADVPMRAARPMYCALSNARLRAAAGVEMPDWRDSLRRYLAATQLGNRVIG